MFIFNFLGNPQRSKLSNSLIHILSTCYYSFILYKITWGNTEEFLKFYDRGSAQPCTLSI